MSDVRIFRDKPSTQEGTVTIVVGSERRTLSIADWSKLTTFPEPMSALPLELDRAAFLGPMAFEAEPHRGP